MNEFEELKKYILDLFRGTFKELDRIDSKLEALHKEHKQIIERIEKYEKCKAEAADTSDNNK